MSAETLNVMMVGDIIGGPGLEQIYLKLPAFRKKEKIELVIANGENSDEGFGITEDNIAQYRQCGVDVITSGNHIWSNRDADKILDSYHFVLRPANYPDAPGKGYWNTEISGIKISVVNLMGRYYMTPIDCPFQILNKLFKSEIKSSQLIFVDFHAESNTEKQALAYDFDGRVTVVAGTHTHVQTADEKILPKGTGYITDLGLSGGIDSVIGMDKDSVLQKIFNQTTVPFTPSRLEGRMQGLLIKINRSTLKIEKLERINI